MICTHDPAVMNEELAEHRVRLQPVECTLTDAEINAIGQRLVAAAAKATGATLRSWSGDRFQLPPKAGAGTGFFRAVSASPGRR